MSKLIEIAKSYRQIDDTFYEKYGVELGALHGLVERRREWHEAFQRLVKERRDDDGLLISPTEATGLLGFASAAHFRRNRETRDTPYPKTPSQILGALETHAPRVFGVRINEIAGANAMSATQVRATLSRKNFSLSGHFAYPPELISCIAATKRIHQPAGELLTERHLALELGRDERWVRRRLVGFVACKRLDDGGRVQKHYPKQVVSYLRRISELEAECSSSALVDTFAISKKAIEARIRRRSTIRPLYEATPPGRKTQENIYPKEIIEFLRQDLITNPPRRSTGL